MHKHIDLFIKCALHPEQKNHNVAWNSNSHLITLFSIAVSLKAKRILELGMWHGNSTQALLCAAKTTGGLLEPVDRSRALATGSFDPNKNDQLKKHWKFYKCDAIEFLENLPSDLIYDLIFIDDDIAYKHVKKELSTLTKHVNKKSVILMHDLMNASDPEYSQWIEKNKPEENHGEATRAVQELSKENWEYATLPVCNGLTILRKIKD